MNSLNPSTVITSQLTGNYDPALIVLSIVFAILASSCALDVSARIRAAQSLFENYIWLGAGAVTIGSGVWAMHFTGMLAFSLSIPVKYDFLTTLISVAPAQFAGGVALYIMSHERLRTKRLLIGGILMGTGIGAMHHIGMMAMRMNAVMHHDQLLFAASVMAAMLIAVAALYVEAKGRDKTSRLHFHGSRFLSALVMGLAVASMHYTAMAAVSFSSIGAPDAEPIGMGAYEMAVWVGLIVLGVVALWKITTIFGHLHEATRLLEHEFREHERTGQELKTSEKSLKEQIQRFNAALDNIPAGLCMYDKNHVLVVSNDNFAKMYGVSPELLKPGTTMREVMEQRIANGVYAGESPEAYIENRLKWVSRRKAGSKTETLVDGRAIQITQQPMENGVWLTIHEDISERKRAEAALQESEEQFRNLVEGSIQGLFIARDWKLLFANQALADIFGYESPDEVLALGEVGPLIVPEERERIHGYKTMREKGESAPEIYESRGMMKDGSIIDIEFRVRQVDWRGVSAMQCVVIDITERKKAENLLIRHRDHLQELVNIATQDLKTKAEELKEALGKEKELNELQRQFVSMASHEFRTPLAIIDGSAQNLARKSEDITADYLLSKTSKIRDAVARMTRLMESTLTAASMEEGMIKVTIGPCDIAKIVRDVSARQEELDKNHVITCDLADLPETIQADTGSLEQVLTNLLSNAVKYAPDAPDIEVKARREGHQVAISVRDHGIGIDEEDLNRIGERFFRAKTSTGIVGTGIGLNLVQTLVEIHGGSVNVESKKGKGSIFTVRLPIAGPDQSEQADIRVA